MRPQCKWFEDSIIDTTLELQETGGFISLCHVNAKYAWLQGKHSIPSFALCHCAVRAKMLLRSVSATEDQIPYFCEDDVLLELNSSIWTRI